MYEGRGGRVSYSVRGKGEKVSYSVRGKGGGG